MCDLAEIEATLRDASSGLQDRIIRDIGRFTVALFGVSQSREGDCLQLGGTGTLVSVGDCHYILTAAHVWEEGLKSARMVGITVKEAVGSSVPNGKGCHRFFRGTKARFLGRMGTLEGMAFHQSDLANEHRTLRCHGLQSISASMP